MRLLSLVWTMVSSLAPEVVVQVGGDAPPLLLGELLDPPRRQLLDPLHRQLLDP